jgi:hypothetical protein
MEYRWGPSFQRWTYRQIAPGRTVYGRYKTLVDLALNDLPKGSLCISFPLFPPLLSSPLFSSPLRPDPLNRDRRFLLHVHSASHLICTTPSPVTLSLCLLYYLGSSPSHSTTTTTIILLFTAYRLLFPVHLLVDIFTTTTLTLPTPIFLLPTTTMEGPLEQVLEHPKSPDFIDAATSGFTYDSLAGLDYLQYPHTEAFGMPSIHRTSPSTRFLNLRSLIASIYIHQPPPVWVSQV